MTRSFRVHTSFKAAAPMDSLCDNTLAHVVSFLDFSSAVRLSRTTSKALASRGVSNGRTHLWKEIYNRHCFAPTCTESDMSTVIDQDYLEECRTRRRLFHNLLGKGKNRYCTCFNLPNRYFYFVPVIPPEDDDWDIAPPFDFDCPRFLLSGGGTNGEMVFLDPFDGSVVIQESCLDNAVKNDEAMIEHAMTDASTLITSAKAGALFGWKDDAEQHIAGAVIEESVFRNHNMEHYQQGPKQVLMGASEHFQIDLSEYFHFSNQRGRHEVALLENEEIEIYVVGIQSKSVVVPGQQVRCSMVAVERILSTYCEESGNSKVCTEMVMWKREVGATFDRRFVCRIQSSLKSMEMDPASQRIYVSFPFNEGPFRRLDAYVQDEHTDHVDFDGGSRVVAAYPMEAYPEKVDEDVECNGPQHFPQPLFFLKCHHPVSTLSVAPCGMTVLTATTNGTIEFWETGELGGAKRSAVIDVRAAVDKSLTKSTALTVGREQAANNETSSASSASAVVVGPLMTNGSGSHAVSGRVDNDEVAEGAIDPVVTSFHLPTNQSHERCGFVTLHHVHGQKSSLLLWSKEDDGSFQIVSTITLPVSSRRKPRIHYDGRRLLVCGQDHIGMIILVYRILNSWEDLDNFVVNASAKTKGNESGGISNLTNPQRVKYGNRIRHAALGGMEFYDSMYMTANERFVVVNTKTGHLLGGGSTPGTDGLLVIDLEEYVS